MRGRRARGVRRAGGDGDGFDLDAVTAAVERLRRENERLRDELEAEFEAGRDASSVVTPTVVATESVEAEVEVEASTSPCLLYTSPSPRD